MAFEGIWWLAVALAARLDIVATRERAAAMEKEPQTNLGGVSWVEGGRAKG